MRWRITRWTAGTSNSTVPTGGSSALVSLHRGCYDLEAHEKATGQRLRAWRNYPEPKVVEINGWTIDGAKAGPAFRALAGQVKSKVEALGPEASFPLTVVLDGGEEVLVEEEHVKRVQRTETVAGEWFIPHVVEPAFGIDRIIWHLLDHAYEESGSGEEMYVRMRLHPDVAPVDAAVLPLFEKEGMDTMARGSPPPVRDAWRSGQLRRKRFHRPQVRKSGRNRGAVLLDRGPYVARRRHGHLARSGHGRTNADVR